MGSATNWQDILKFGSIVATIALSAGMLMSEVRSVKDLVQEQKLELKATSLAVQNLQIEGARRASEFLLLDRRLTQIEGKLNLNRNP